MVAQTAAATEAKDLLQRVEWLDLWKLIYNKKNVLFL